MVQTRATEDAMLDIPEGSAGHGCSCRMRHTVEWSGVPTAPPAVGMNMSYSNFLATHPLIFSGATDPLDADDWLRTTESKFSMLHCTEY
jgi:hypothetical protein